MESKAELPAAWHEALDYAKTNNNVDSSDLAKILRDVLVCRSNKEARSLLSEIIALVKLRHVDFSDNSPQLTALLNAVNSSSVIHSTEFRLTGEKQKDRTEEKQTAGGKDSETNTTLKPSADKMTPGKARVENITDHKRGKHSHGSGKQKSRVQADGRKCDTTNTALEHAPTKPFPGVTQPAFRIITQEPVDMEDVLPFVPKKITFTKASESKRAQLRLLRSTALVKTQQNDQALIKPTESKGTAPVQPTIPITQDQALVIPDDSNDTDDLVPRSPYMNGVWDMKAAQAIMRRRQEAAKKADEALASVGGHIRNQLGFSRTRIIGEGWSFLTEIAAARKMSKSVEKKAQVAAEADTETKAGDSGP